MKKRISREEHCKKPNAASEPLKRAKTETIHTLAGIGRRHKLLRYPMLVALVVFIFIYNVILYGLIHLKVREKFARGVALFMTAILAFTSVDLTVLAAAGGDIGQRVIAAFGALDEAVAAQSVPLGAGEGEINFPEILAVTLEAEDEAGGLEAEEGTEPSETEAPADGEEPAGTEAELAVTWGLDAAQSTSETFDSSEAGNCYVYVPVIPEKYTVAEGVSLPVITVTIQEPEEGAAVELLMRPYDEENSSDMVYYLADAYDTYSWEIWNGWEWEELEYFEPELVVGKEEWYAYRFRCVAEKDGVRYTANAADDWQTGDSGMMFAENEISAEVSASSGKSDYMYYNNDKTIESYGKKFFYFNVKGIDNGKEIQTTYKDVGYRTASKVNGDSKVDWNSPNEMAMGSSLYGTREISLVYNGRYAKITYTVENRGSTAQSFQVGSSADVMIGSNDYAPVVGSANGLKMSGEPKNSYTFNLVAPTASTLWYGHYSGAYDNIFTNLADREKEYKKDSGMAWSWSDSVAPGQTWSRYVLVGVGELPESPKEPTLTNQDPIVLSPGTTTTITGTADAGSTVVMEVGGEEFSGETDEDGNFSVTITTPADMPDGNTNINYYAVSEDGGLSDMQSIPATVVSAPSITLTDSTASVMEDSVLDEAWYEAFIKTSSGEVSHTAIATGTPGTYDVIYTAARDGYADATATLVVTVLPQPLELSEVTATRVRTTDSFTLSAKLNHVGGEEISETGFVWGIMQNPTISMNNGQRATSAAVNTKGGTLTVTAEKIVDGVTYYARAYARTSGGDVYYGPQKDFSINGKSYGSFTITNNGSNTFTVTRTGGTDGAQTVYFRTVNGSAVGGTHFTHQAGKLTFLEGDASEEIIISENNVATSYKNSTGTSYPATAYSNAARTYSVEIYRVDGGGTLGSTTSATRTMDKDSSYAVDRSIYSEQVINGPQEQKTRGDYDKDKLGWTEGKSYSAAIETVSIKDSLLPGIRSYWTSTAQNLYYQLSFTAWEEESGYQAVQITPGTSLDTSAYPYQGSLKGSLSNAYYMVLFEHDGSGKSSTKLTHTFPMSSGSTGSKSASERIMDGTHVRFDIGQENLSVGYGASGDGSDKWCTTTVKHHFWLKDVTEPQLLAIAPMAGGTYKEGDKVTLSLIFDEIVDSKNSTLSKVSLDTSWGTFTYAGGADTNVLYFTGTVPSDATGTITVKNITGASYIRDMCSDSSTASSGGSGSVTVTVDNTTPTVSISNTSVKNGTATATISGTHTDSLKYTWTQSNTMPATGWLTATNGQTVSTRQNSGTWYLHVLGTYNATGKTAHTCASFDFDSGTSGSMPELTLSADNSTWAQSRTITLTRKPSDATVTVKKPDGTVETVNGADYTAETNGSYTFTLTANGETVVQSITVSRIDRTAPTAVIAGPSSTTQNENVTLTITPTDAGGSGVRSVTGKWTTITNGGSAAAVPATLTKNSDGTYSATSPGTAGNIDTYQLTVTVADNAGNTGSAISSTYTVNLKAPTITVTKKDDQSGSAGDVYDYLVMENGNTITAIQLPDGTITTALTGTFTLTAPGTYYVTVSDAAGHVVRSDAMTVTGNVDGNAPDVRLYQPDENWTNEEVALDVSVYEEVGISSAVWKMDGDASNTAGTALECREIEESVYSSSFSVTENGTYTVTVTDDSGNEGTASITVSNIDKAAPVIGALRYSYEPKNLWDWLIGKESLTITVPVTEKDSGADTVAYTVTPENGLAEDKTSEIKDGSAEIIVSADFKGTIAINCTDKAGNTSSRVTVGAAGTKLLIEDNAPQISFGTYTASGMTVTVTDDGENAISAGLASVTYQIKNGETVSEEVSVTENFTESLKTTVSFNIDPELIQLGSTEITVKATDNAGNEAKQTVTVARYNVTLHENGGSGGTSLTAYTYGTGTALPTDWTKAGYKFGGWYGNEGCTGEAVTAITATDTGDKVYWAKWVDDIAPVTGALSYSYQPTTLWDWLIGKESLTITVPVTEEGSGADEITYTVTPEGDGAQKKSAKIENGSAEITVSADFKGTIAITCTDKAGNTSLGVTVGVSGKGLIIEDNAPEISFQVNGSMPSSEYAAVPEITVTVADDGENAISAGLASVAYKIGDGEEVSVQENFAESLKTKVGFTIPKEQIPAGGVEITVKATDNAGNQSKEKLAIHVHSGTLVEAKAANCTEDGNIEHYLCNCGKQFSDSGCTQPLTAEQVRIPALGHIYGESYEHDGAGHWNACSRCGAADTKQSHVYDNGSDTTCNVCGYERTIPSTGGGGGGGGTSGGGTPGSSEPSEPTKPSESTEPTEPTKPSESTEPTEPTKPSESTEPTEPAEPSKPAESTKPTKPTEPTKPAEPSKPTEPTKPSTPSTPTTPATPNEPTAPVTPNEPTKPSTPTAPATPNEPTAPTTQTTPTTPATPTPGTAESGTSTVTATSDDGKIAVSNDVVATGNVDGMDSASTKLQLADGAVIVTVVCEEQKYTAGVADTVAVANAVLSPEQVQLVADGETIEIRIDVTDISGKVPPKDQMAIESGIAEYQKEVPRLTLGMYVDISMFIKIGESDWNAVTKTNEPIEVVVGIPEELRSDGRKYYIVRSHEGEYAILEDVDDNPDTITIRTDKFSAYAIAYEQTEVQTIDTGSHRCGLCHICPTFLGICYFVWLAIMILILILVLVLVILLHKRKERTSGRHGGQSR